MRAKHPVSTRLPDFPQAWECKMGLHWSIAFGASLQGLHFVYIAERRKKEQPLVRKKLVRWVRLLATRMYIGINQVNALSPFLFALIMDTDNVSLAFHNKVVFDQLIQKWNGRFMQGERLNPNQSKLTNPTR